MRAVIDRIERPARVRGARMGMLRRRRPAVPDRGPWPGDLNGGIWYARAIVPVWVNGIGRARRIRALGFAVGCTLVLTGSRALMALV